MGTQFPETVSDYLENRRLRVLTAKSKGKPQGVLTKLLEGQRAIKEHRHRLNVCEAWLAHCEYLSAEQVAKWKAERAKTREYLRGAKTEF